MGKFTIACLKNALLFIVTIAILFSVLEIATRTVSDIKPNLRQKDIVIGYRYARSTEQDVFDGESGRVVHMRFNSSGFRGRDFKKKPTSGITRIAIVGDSMVAALQVPEEKTMVALVERRLNRKYGNNRWEVMNFGISGSSPGQSIAVWRNEIAQFNPDVVLLAYFNGNDFANNCKCIDPKVGRIYFDLDSDGVYRQQPHSELQTQLSQFLNENSTFYLWQKAAFKTLRHRLEGKIVDGEYVRTWKDGDWVYATKSNEDVDYAWRLSAAAINTLNQEVSKSGAKFGVIILPHGPQIYDDLFEEVVALRPKHEWEPVQENPDKRLLEICKANQVNCWSLLRYFKAAAPSASNEVDKEALFYVKGDGHFNELGNEVAAEGVVDFFDKVLID
jgi:hypothetical protein